jgi:hypothetical protein
VEERVRSGRACTPAGFRRRTDWGEASIWAGELWERGGGRSVVMKRCPGALTKDSFDEAFFWESQFVGRRSGTADDEGFDCIS